mmetsp:Transcript_62768/g.174905  ORF Transcript_62768/g.174905 Transcript_62768/m.174905 type:complete len:251 (+) Transcript_62768:989-1741(+)
MQVPIPLVRLQAPPLLVVDHAAAGHKRPPPKTPRQGEWALPRFGDIKTHRIGFQLDRAYHEMGHLPLRAEGEARTLGKVSAGWKLGAHGVSVANVAARKVRLGVGIVPVRVHVHGVNVIGGVAHRGLDVRTRRLEVETGEDTGDVHDVLVRVRLHVAVAGIHTGAVRIKLPQADGEQLHKLSGVVLVGHIPCCVEGLVPQRRQVHAHDRAVRHFAQQIPEVAEGVANEDVVISHPHLGVCVEAGSFRARH